jgi:hypothetical protein
VRYRMAMFKRPLAILAPLSALVFLLGSVAAPKAAQGGSECGFDSDCKGNGKCKGGKCGNCGFDSDCSVGKCGSGRCGTCSFDSDCKGGKCNNHRCSNAR